MLNAFRGIRARAILAGGLLALGASFMPAHAAAGDPAPTLRATSIDNGWSKFDDAVAATYDRPLTSLRSASNIVITDRAGATVAGAVRFQQTQDKLGHTVTDARTIIFTPDAELASDLGPYDVTFTAHGFNQDIAASDTSALREFRVDNSAPYAPTVANLETPVLLATDNLVIKGQALERSVGDDSNISGISSLVLHFYNPVAKVAAGQIDKDRLGSEVLTKSIAVACAGGYCPVKPAFTDTETPKGLNLMPGLWNLRVSSIDLAGNTSGESSTISFIVLPSAG